MMNINYSFPRRMNTWFCNFEKKVCLPRFIRAIGKAPGKLP